MLHVGVSDLATMINGYLEHRTRDYSAFGVSALVTMINETTCYTKLVTIWANTLL